MDGTEEPALASGASAQELVPGSAPAILALAVDMTSLGDVLEESATALSRVEVTGWYGAASAAAHDRLGQEPSRWVAASGAFLTACAALRRYAAALAPARAQAEQAVEAYRRYLDLVRVLEVATTGVVPSTGGTTAVPGSGQLATSVPDRAQLGHRAAVLIAADRGETNGAGVIALGPLGTDLPGLAQTADALRRHAIALLADARAQALTAGDAAADSVEAAMADAPRARTFWQGTIRRPGAEDAGHTTLDLVGWLPGWVGMGATALNVGWYALEGDRENAGYAAMGFVPIGMGKLGKEIVSGNRVFRFASKTDLLRAESEDLPGFARAMGLERVAGETDTFVSAAGIRYTTIPATKYAETHRLTHVLSHCFPADPLKVKPHSIFVTDPGETIRLIDDVWRLKPEPLANDPMAYVVDMHEAIGTRGETMLRLIMRANADGTVSIVSAYPEAMKSGELP